jgi:hypothetical protein
LAFGFRGLTTGVGSGHFVEDEVENFRLMLDSRTRGLVCDVYDGCCLPFLVLGTFEIYDPDNGESVVCSQSCDE